MKPFLISLFSILFSSGLAAQEWQIFRFTDAGGIFCASSELNKPDDFTLGKYSPRNLLDHDPATAWVEGKKGDGTGESVCLALGDHLKKYAAITNGYQKSHDLFLQNNRIRAMKATLYVAFTDDMQETQAGFVSTAIPFPATLTFPLKDTEGIQYVPLSFDTAEVHSFRDSLLKKYVLSHKKELSEGDRYLSLKDFYFVKFEITGVYKGSKWDDTCLSGLTFTHRKSPQQIPAGIRITGVEENDSSSAVLVKTTGPTYTLTTAEEGAKIFHLSKDEMEGLVLSVLSVSPGKEWAVVAFMNGGPGMRTEEIDKLFSVRYLQEVPADLLKKYNAGDPLDFSEEGGKTIIECTGNSIPAEDILEDMIQQNGRVSFRNDGPYAKKMLRL